MSYASPVAASGPVVLLPGEAMPAYEVATIKPTARTDGGWHLRPTPDGYSGLDVSLKRLVQEAYGIEDKSLVIGGPSWVDLDKFDVEAKFDVSEVPDAKKLTYRERADMLQPLLADRFRLKVHHEMKVFPVYALVVAKKVAKLHESERSSCKGYDGCTMTELAMQLRYIVGRPVVDRTGLIGRFDYSFLNGSSASVSASSDSSAPSIFTAVQEQLGLKLEPSSAPIDVLVIDSAELPSGN